MTSNPAFTTLRKVILALACISIVFHLYHDWTLGSIAVASNKALISRAITMLLIIGLVVGVKSETRRYATLILAGLVSSMAGDFFMAHEDAYFLYGLIAFLIAHILYIAAFVQAVPWRKDDWKIALPFVALGFGLFAALIDGLGDMLIPTLFYTIVICVMGWRAGVRCLARRGDASGWLPLIGAVLFIASDGILAWNRFHTPFEWKQFAVMITYYGAQVCFALSVLYDAAPRTPEPQPA